MRCGLAVTYAILESTIMVKSIAVAGSLAQRPGHGGHAWVFLQYLLGFRRLGWDVLFLDRLEPKMCRDDSGRPCSIEDSYNLKYFLEVMQRFGLADAFALLCERGSRCIGRSRQDVLDHLRRSACVINVMGFLDDEEILAAAPLRVFLDIDPGFGQMWHDLGLADVFRGHDSFITIGSNIGQARCTIPTCGLSWIKTPQPIVLNYWPRQENAGGEFITSIASWRGPFGPIEYQGRTYGLRVHEFRKFFELPRVTGQRFQLALDIDEAEVRDRTQLHANDWALVDPREVAGTPWAYQSYVQNSRAEFMAAKNMYVQSQSGWFSDRSICYLASGRPVLAQDTGLQGLYPTGEGLITFRTLEEAAAGAEELKRDYPHHCRAARDLAEAVFDSDKVLSRLLANLGIP